MQELIKSHKLLIHLRSTIKIK